MRTIQPRKQRRQIFTMPLHERHKLVGSHLSAELRKRYSTRSMPVRKGDRVKIMRGKFKRKEGKVVRVNLDQYEVYIDGITRSKTEGTKVFVPIHPSKLMITELDVSDKMRTASLRRKGGMKKESKPEKKEVEK